MRTLSPAQGWAVRSCVALPSTRLALARGNCSGITGGSSSGSASSLAAASARHRREIAFLAFAQREAGLGAGHAVIVVGAEHQAQGAARRGGRGAHQIDGRRFVLDQLEPPFGHGLRR